MNKSLIQISKRSFLSVIVILTLLILISYVLALFIPQGNFLRDSTGQIIGPYVEATQPLHLPFWKVILSPLFVFFSSDGISILMIALFLVILGGAFEVMQSVQGIQVLLHRLVKRFASKKYMLLRIVTLFFMAFGAFFGIFEESVAIMPIVILLAISLGWDTLTGMGMSVLASAFGFASAITNPFSVGIASNLAQISILSGVWLRFIVFGLMYALLSTFLVHYAKKVEKNKAASLTYAIDQAKDQNLQWAENIDSSKEFRVFRTYTIFFLTLLFAIFLTSILEVTEVLSIPSIVVMALFFLVGGILSGWRINASLSTTCKVFLKGVASIAPAIILIAFAGAVKYIITEANVLDTILHSLSNYLSTMPSYLAILVIYGLILVIQFFIGSASAKAILIIPILIPIVQLIGISNELAILAFLFGDGYTNVIFPTNAVLLIALSMANVRYTMWFKWTIKLQIVVLLLTALLLLLAFFIGY